MAHHLALCRVGVDVAAEERWSEQQRHGPDRDDQHDALHGKAVVSVEVAEEPEPDAGEEDEPAEHERERGDRSAATSLVPSEPNGPPGMPKNHAPARWVSKDWPPMTAPTTIAVVPTRPEDGRARHAQAEAPAARRAGATAVSGGAVEVVAALGGANSIGVSLPARPRRATAGGQNLHQTAVILSQLGPILGTPKPSLTGFSGSSQATGENSAVT